MRDQHVPFVMPLMKAPIEQCNACSEAAAAQNSAEEGDLVTPNFVAETIWQDLFKDNFAVPPRRAIEGALTKNVWSPSK